MAKHKTRMQSIGLYNDPILKAMAQSYAQENYEKDPGFKKEVERRWKKTRAIVEAQLKNGAGFGINKVQRSFLLEYNERNFKHGLDSMPSSFNVMEAFFEHKPELAFFRMRDEKDHLFSMSEFIDFATSPDEKDGLNRISTISDYMEENIIYSYSVCSKIEDFTFSSKQGAEYAIAGLSMIRYGTEINLLMLIGEKTNLKEMSEVLNSKMSDVNWSRGRENIKPSPDLKREAVPLENGKDYWQILIATRFDMSDATQNVRYVMQDCGNSYSIITDDVNIFHSETRENTVEMEKFFKENLDRLQPYEVIFEVCKTMLLLPAYFWTYGEHVVDERHQTELFSEINKVKWLTRKKLLSPKEIIGHRIISVLIRDVTNLPNIVSYSTPEIKIETAGFWKMLPLNKVGKDKKGNVIHGRTWVQQTLSWIEKDAQAGIVTTKNNSIIDIANGPNKGRIYVMRSASDKKNIYKIGLTRKTAEERAVEISAGTGVPTKYLVVEDWEVADCVIAEEMIHKELDKYRINNRREFFQVPYKTIRSTIESIIDLVNGSQSE